MRNDLGRQITLNEFLKELIARLERELPHSPEIPQAVRFLEKELAAKAAITTAFLELAEIVALFWDHTSGAQKIGKSNVELLSEVDWEKIHDRIVSVVNSLRRITC